MFRRPLAVHFPQGSFSHQFDRRREVGQPESRVPWATVIEAIADLPPPSSAGGRGEGSHPHSEATQYEIQSVTEYQS
jgi:hypothetical protein